MLHSSWREHRFPHCGSTNWHSCQNVALLPLSSNKYLEHLGPQSRGTWELKPYSRDLSLCLEHIGIPITHILLSLALLLKRFCSPKMPLFYRISLSSSWANPVSYYKASDFLTSSISACFHWAPPIVASYSCFGGGARNAKIVHECFSEIKPCYLCRNKEWNIYILIKTF